MKNRIEIILNNKILLSGIAILMVMFYHQPPDGIVSGVYFYPGFAGVDVFLLLSGYGLCFSINKYKLGQFYRRRFLRIFPLLLVLGFLVSFNFYGYTVWDFICNMTSLYYYGLGGDVYEWYLASLFLFYLFFPLLYIFSNKLSNGVVLRGGGNFVVVGFDSFIGNSL